MPRTPEDCSFRTPIGSSRGTAATCGLVARVMGTTDPQLCLVQRDACAACCQALRRGESINPVVASLVYNAASRIVQTGGHPQCSEHRARQLMQCAVDQMGVLFEGFPDRSFPPQLADIPDESPTPSPRPPARPLTWAVGLMTAPRRVPTLQRTLRSLDLAGFGLVHVFAEPKSRLPPECDHLPVTVHRRRLGTLLNFYSSLSTLLDNHPASDAFAIFQDDIEAASGLKTWCETQLWPLESGVVSLFTPHLHNGPEPGWRLLSPGYQRVCGAQALVFRRDVLQRFLSDPRVTRRLLARRHNNDAVVGGWAAREGLGIAYHTPSLVRHIGRTSSIYAQGTDPRNSAHAVSSVEQLQHWRRPAARQAVIGLVGWNTPTGLGYLNRDLSVHSGIDRWLVPRHPRLASLGSPGRNVRLQALTDRRDERQLSAWLAGLDWLLFVERPPAVNVVRLAAHAGIGVACVPMWEWLQPDLAWLAFVDLMICPTRHTLLHMTDWKQRYGFGWEAVYVPWPIDAARFRFHRRKTCRRFLFVNGWGGAPARRFDGAPLNYGRKGFELISAAARLAPHLPFLVYSQAHLMGLPPNVELRSPPTDNVDLYREGDVCVQPSHYEGLGLQLLECQAAGMPLVTTDAPPMNEHQPLKTVPVCGTEVVCVGGGPISSQQMHPADLVGTLEPLVGADIREASQAAREFITSQHCWEAAIVILRQAMTKR